jgi:hypothetical protein
MIFRAPCSGLLVALLLATQPLWAQQVPQPNTRIRPRDILYAAVPDRASSLPYGGIGILAFDVKDNFRLIKRISAWEYAASQEPDEMRGIAASPANGLLYVSTSKVLAAFDLLTDKKVWEQAYDGECCDRLGLSPDGKTIYVPSYRRGHWYVVDALTGKLIKKLPTPQSNTSHNTIWSMDGSRVFMEGQGSPTISVADPKTHTVVQTVGPFSNFVRPFTINGNASYLYANVNELLGFEVADLKTGKMIHRVEVKGFGWSPDRIFEHGTPSHGIALSPDEKEVWLADAVNANGYVHIFDATVMPPKQMKSVKTRDLPAWITFGIDGKFVYLSSGDVIDASTKEIVGGLKDEFGHQVRAEKVVEVLFENGKPVRTVDQFGVGKVRREGSN